METIVGLPSHLHREIGHLATTISRQEGVKRTTSSDNRSKSHFSITSSKQICKMEGKNYFVMHFKHLS